MARYNKRHEMGSPAAVSGGWPSAVRHSSGAIDNWLASATATGVCDSIASITHDYAGVPGNCNETRSTVVTWTATDTQGHTATTTATLTLLPDTAPPDLTIPPNVTAESASPDGSYTFASRPFATGGDDCSDVTISFSRSDGRLGLLDPYNANDSPIIITWTAADACGNTATGTNVITINFIAGDRYLLVDVELSPAMDDPSASDGDVVTRCITFELWRCRTDTVPSAVVRQSIQFPVDAGQPHRVEGVRVDIPAGIYTCATARDERHSLRSTAADFTDHGNFYSATFVGNRTARGHWLLHGNLNDDDWIDMLDFGEYVIRFQTLYPNGNAPCGTPVFHADFSGDGRVFTEDLAFIHINYLSAPQPNCGGAENIDGR